MPDKSVSGIARTGRGGVLHAAQREDHHEEEDRAREESAPRVQAGDERPGQRRTDRARDVERNRAQGHCARHVDSGHEVVDARGLCRQVECEAGADQKREGEERGRRDGAEERDRSERGRGYEKGDLRDQDDSPAVDQIRERAGEEPQQQGGRRAGRLHERHHERRWRQRRHQPGDDRGLCRVAERCADGSDVELPEGSVAKR